MSIATRFVSSTARPRLDLSGCVLFAPLWRPDLGGSTFTTIGDGGITTHLCTVTGATYGIQGRTYDGVDDYIDAGNNTILDCANGVSVIAWIKTSTPTQSWGCIVSKGSDQAYQLRFSGATGKIEFGTVTGVWNTVTGDTALSANIWYQIVGVYDLANMSLFLNGISDATPVAETGTITTNTVAVNIGRRTPASTYYDGSVGEVVIYNRALSAQEIQQNHLATKWRYQ